jgi:hypothetical protein
MPQRQWRPTTTTLVHDVLERGHHIRDAAEAAAETGNCSHCTVFIISSHSHSSSPFPFPYQEYGRTQRDSLGVAACLRSRDRHFTDAADRAVHRSREALEGRERGGVLVIVALVHDHWLLGRGLSHVLLLVIFHAGGLGVGWLLLHCG